MAFIAKAICTCLFVGNIKGAPGTYGSIIPLLLLFFLPAGSLIFFIFFLTSAAVGLWAIPIYAPNGNLDHSSIVIDEFSGMSLSLAFGFWSLKNPLVFSHTFIFVCVCSFILFRLLDIFKPSYIGTIDRLKHPMATMGDDILAGAVAGIATYIFRIILF